MTFAKGGKRFFDDSRMIMVFVLFLTLALSEGVILAIQSEWYGMPIIGTKAFLIVIMLGDLWFHVFCIRAFAIKEKDLKASYQKQKDNHITNLQPFWSVFDIDDNKLMYIDGRMGMLVFMKHGYVYGRPPQHKATHFNGLTQFIGELSLKGYEIRHFNLAVVDANTEGLDSLQIGMASMRTTPLYAYQSAVYDYVREVCKQVSTVEHEYYLVLGNTMNHILNLETDVTTAMTHLQGTLMTNVHIATPKEIYEFIQKYYNITYTDVRKLMSTQVYGSDKKLIKVLESYYDEPEPEEVEIKEEAVTPEADLMLERLLEEQKEADAKAMYLMGKVILDIEDQEPEKPKQEEQEESGGLLGLPSGGQEGLPSGGQEGLSEGNQKGLPEGNQKGLSEPKPVEPESLTGIGTQWEADLDLDDLDEEEEAEPEIPRKPIVQLAPRKPVIQEEQVVPGEQRSTAKETSSVGVRAEPTSAFEGSALEESDLDEIDLDEM